MTRPEDPFIWTVDSFGVIWASVEAIDDQHVRVQIGNRANIYKPSEMVCDPELPEYIRKPWDRLRERAEKVLLAFSRRRKA